MGIFLAIRAALRLVPWRLVVAGAVAAGVLFGIRHVVGQLRTVGELRAAVEQEREARQAVERAATRLRAEVARRQAAAQRYAREARRLNDVLQRTRGELATLRATDAEVRAWADTRLPGPVLRLVCQHVAATHGVPVAAAAPGCRAVAATGATGGDERGVAAVGVVAGPSTGAVPGSDAEGD